MFNVAVLDDWNHSAKRFLYLEKLPENINLIVFHESFMDEPRMIAALQDQHCIVLMRERTRFHAGLFDALPNLCLLITSGPKNSAIDLKAAEKHGVVVSGTKSLKEPPTELTIALMLNLARHIQRENTAFKTGGPWQTTLGVSLHGKTLGLLGFGSIGSRVARIAQAMGMSVIAWSQNLSMGRAVEHGVRLADSKEMLLRYSDIISIHLRFSERTKALLGAEAFKLMKPTCLLINTSRAEIVDQGAMIAALKSGQIAGAAADVFEEEPLPLSHPLRSLPNFLGVPHLGYVTDSNYEEYFPGAVRAIKAFLDSDPIMELYPSTTMRRPGLTSKL